MDPQIAHLYPLVTRLFFRAYLSPLKGLKNLQPGYERMRQRLIFQIFNLGRYPFISWVERSNLNKAPCSRTQFTIAAALNAQPASPKRLMIDRSNNRYCTIQCGTIRSDSIQSDPILCETIQCNVIRCDAMRCDKMQNNVMQFSAPVSTSSS